MQIVQAPTHYFNKNKPTALPLLSPMGALKTPSQLQSPEAHFCLPIPLVPNSSPHSHYVSFSFWKTQETILLIV
jgi:hypothetical protein